MVFTYSEWRPVWTLLTLFIGRFSCHSSLKSITIYIQMYSSTNFIVYKDNKMKKQILLFCLNGSVRFPHTNDVRFVFTSSSLYEGSCLIYIICACLSIVVSNTYGVGFLFLFSSSGVPYVDTFKCTVPQISLYTKIIKWKNKYYYSV
jgi:hypothetical protein